MTGRGRSRTIRVLIVDDHEMARRGMAAMLATADGIRVVGEAVDGPSAVEAARLLQPDVILLDIRMPGGDGLQSIEELRALEGSPAVAVVTLYDESGYLVEAVRRGASGYMTKEASRQEVIDTVRAVARGGLAVDPIRLRDALAEAATASRNVTTHERAMSFSLTAREVAVLRWVAAGSTNKEIGARLSITEDTAKKHVQNIIWKLRAADRTQAAVLALQLGLIESADSH